MDKSIPQLATRGQTSGGVQLPLSAFAWRGRRKPATVHAGRNIARCGDELWIRRVGDRDEIIASTLLPLAASTWFCFDIRIRNRMHYTKFPEAPATAPWDLVAAASRRLDKRIVDAALRGIVVYSHVENRWFPVEPGSGIVLRSGLCKSLLRRLAVLELEHVYAAPVL